MTSSGLHRSILATLLIIQSALLAYNAAKNSPTWDEVGHLGAGVSHWDLGDFSQYCVNPPLVRVVAAFPIVFLLEPDLDWRDFSSNPRDRTEVAVGRRFIEVNAGRFEQFFIIARWMCIPLVLLGTVSCYFWGRDLFGPDAGVLSAGLWTFSPMVLGHGALITPDVAAASAGLAAFYSLRRWLIEPTWERCLPMAACFSLALLIKATWIVCLLIVPLVWLSWRLLARRSPPPDDWHLGRDLAQLTITVIGIFAVLNAFYGFQDVGRRLGEFEFVSSDLAGRTIKDRRIDFDNKFSETWLGSLPVPLPTSFVQGIDIQRFDFERAVRPPGWRSYLCGTYQLGGWWYYYLVGFSVKEPLPWLLLFALSLPLVAARQVPGCPLHEAIALLVPAIVVLIIVSSQTDLSRHVRYALPVLPFFIVWTCQYAVWFRGRRLRTWLLTVLLVWQVGSVLYVTPHHLSYFNELAGGPMGGHRALDNSNLDWGQDLWNLREWLAEHPEAKDLRLAYLGCFDPRLAGIEFELPPPYLPNADSRHGQYGQGPEPGWFAVSVAYVLGSRMNVPDGNGNFIYFGHPAFQYFEEFEPIDRAGYSIWIYHLEPEEVSRVRHKLGLPPLAESRVP